MGDRRHFLRAAAYATAALSLNGVVGCGAAGKSGLAPEVLAKRFHATLTETQRRAICFAWDHPNRSKVSQNWQIVDQTIGTFYTGEQKEILQTIFKGLVTPDGYDRFMKVFRDDAGGFDQYSVALFGDPDTTQFEWVMTGRHLTIRCNADGLPFGGPMFYGHGTGHEVGGRENPDHPGNVWWEQALLANKVYSSLDGRQRERALLVTSPEDSPNSIRIRDAGEFEGIAVAELSRDQRALVEAVMRDLLAPYRATDVDRAMTSITRSGGIERLHLAFYNEQDLGNDGVWDRWMLQGPSLSWFFRGSPHVHTWVNIVEPVPA